MNLDSTASMQAGWTNRGGNNPARQSTPPTSTPKAFARLYRKRARNANLNGERSEWVIWSAPAAGPRVSISRGVLSTALYISSAERTLESSPALSALGFSIYL